MKKIVIESRLVTRNTGITGYFENLLKKLLLIHPENEYILVTDDSEKLKKKIKFKCKIVEIINKKKYKFQSLSDFVYGTWLFPKYITTENADIILSPYYDFIIPNKYHKKVIITVHDLCYFEYYKIFKIRTVLLANYFFKQAIKNSYGIVTVSETTKNKLKLYCRFLNKDLNIVVCYNAFENKIIQPKKPNISERKIKKILYAGGFERRKNIDNMFEVFSDLLKINNQVLLIITGNLKYNKQFIQKIKKFKLDNHVILTGLITKDELNNLYINEIDCAINLSICEGFGRNNYEAKMFGIPLLCSDIEINHEIVGDYPIYCDPYDKKNILKNLIKLINCPKHKPLNSVDERFQLENNFIKFYSLVNELI